MNLLKTGIFRSEKWLRAVASIDCVICGQEGTQAAHRNEGKGMGIKTDDCLTAALCPTCHADIDSGKELTREVRRDLMNRAILDTLCELARQRESEGMTFLAGFLAGALVIVAVLALWPEYRPTEGPES